MAGRTLARTECVKPFTTGASAHMQYMDACANFPDIHHAATRPFPRDVAIWHALENRTVHSRKEKRA